MILKKVDLNEFEIHKIYYFEQIPKAQNSNFDYATDIFDYYQTALKENSQNFVAIAIEKGEMIGCALFRFYNEENKFFVLNVNTKKPFQHTPKKVATNVVKFGLKEVFKMHDKVFLWVDKENVIAQKLYKKLGFETIDYYYPKNLDFLKGQEQHTLIMELGKDKFENVLNSETIAFFF